MTKQQERELIASQAALIEQLKAQLQTKPLASQPITLKVSRRGAVSVYGLGRNPVTLYASQVDAGVTAGTFSPDCGLVKFRHDNAKHLAMGKGVAPVQPLAADGPLGFRYDPAEADRRAEARKVRS